MTVRNTRIQRFRRFLPEPHFDIMSRRADCSAPSPCRSTEHDRADYHQGDFAACGSRGLQLIREKFPVGLLSRRLLLSFATIVSGLSNRRLPRDFTRRQILLLKWLDQEYDAIKPYVQFVNISVAE
jgi:hypothetical protein